MPTSSAEPERLEAYPGQLASANEQLTTLAAELDTAMRDFADGAGAYLPAGFDAAEDGNLVRGLRDESRYLEDWVVSVARAFRAADGDPDGDGIFSASDAFIDDRVGQPTIAGQRAEIRGRRAAHDLSDALTAMGIDPTDLTPAELQRLVSATDDADLRRLYDQMQGIAEDMHDPAFATGFADAMGAEGIRTTLGVIDTFAYIQRDLGEGDWMGDVGTTLLAPFVSGWATATRSPETEDERRDLLNTTDPVEQRHLSLLMSGDPASYDAEFLADAADRILVTGRHLNVAQVPGDFAGTLGPDDYPGLHNTTEWLYDDRGLSVPTVTAMRALDGNPDAAASFMHRGPDRVHALVYPDPLPIPETPRLFEDAARFRNEIAGLGASIVETGVTEATNPDETSRGLVMNNVIDAIGNEDAPIHPNMHGALAAGVEDNMAVIDQRINGGWHTNEYREYVIDGASATRLRTTESFLSEVMDDDHARDRVRAATRTYVEANVARVETTPGDHPGQIEGSRPEMAAQGRILGVTTEAHKHSLERAFQEDRTEAERRGQAADFVVGLLPGAGELNDATEAAEKNFGDYLADGISGPEEEADLRSRMRAVAEKTEQQIGRLRIDGREIDEDDVDAMEAGWLEASNVVI